MTVSLRSSLCLSAAVAVCVATPAVPDAVLTTGEYKQACSRPEERWQSFCRGYVQGMLDFAATAGNACIPDDTDVSFVVQTIEAVAFDMIGTEGFPESQSAVFMTMAVIDSMFPCDG